MPAFDWHEGEAEAVIAYLGSLATKVDKTDVLGRARNISQAGEMLVEAYECFACHRVAGRAGRALYPDLSTIQQRRDAQWERRWLKDPQAIKAGTFMPNFQLSDDEIEAITQYLYH